MHETQSTRGTKQEHDEDLGVPTRLTDIATEDKLETTGHASRNMASLEQNDGLHLSSKAIEQATTHQYLTDKDTLHQMTARVQRPIQAIFSSLEH